MAREEFTVEQWRRKFYDSLEELEEKEKQWQELESILRLLVTRLTLLAETDNETLNQLLEELRQSIRQEKDAFKLRRSIEKISLNISKYDNTAGKRIDPVAPLVSLLDKISVPEQLRKQERHLRKQLSVADSNDIDIIVQNMVDLIGYITEFSDSGPAQAPVTAEPDVPVTETSRETPKQEESRGLLSGLFAKKRDTEQVSEEKNSFTEQAAKKISEVKDKLTDNAPVAAGDVQTATATLIDLIEHFNLPNDLAIEANLIKERLESCNNRKELIVLVENLAQLISEVHKRVEQERNELEEFLKQLTGRLHEMDTDIRETVKLRDESYSQGQNINRVVKQEVDSIETTVAQATDLGTLKNMIQSRVITLRDHMDKFIEAESSRHERSTRLIENLQSRVQTMELETEQLKQEVRKKHEQATSDALTGVANRQAYNERIQVEIARNRRYQSPLTILVWDIDKFKSVNDTYGHAAGDKVLKAVAKVLSMKIRETDFIARFGGEEFVILMPETSIVDAEAVANKLRTIIEACEFHFKEKRVVITASCGLAEIKHNETAEELFERADNALYRAKEQGRNCCIAAS